MNKPSIKIEKFNNTDVIATSDVIIAATTDASQVPIIWLDLESVKNYNKFSKTDTDLLYLDNYMYFGYSGAYN
ncbi:MAG: hypothetical protein KBS52_06725, partial [Clostridiales bacterium]|nr:hypothetical protein [Candidatus Equinaster intestinalis]